MNGKVIHRDWDYLQYFINEARRLGLKVTVSTAMFPSGHPATREGLVYDESRWDGKTAWNIHLTERCLTSERIRKK